LSDEATIDVQPPDGEGGVTSPTPTPTPSAADDNFAAALREFDTTTSATPEKPNGKAEAPPDPAQQVQDTRDQLAAVRQLGELRVWALGVQQERLERREREDAAAIFEQGNERVAEFTLPPDFAERWLRAEYSIDRELNHAWDSRYESDDAMRWCQRCLRRALGRLREAAAHVPDHEATETRAAITAAVTRGGKPPPATAPDYSKMTDQEFRAAVKKEHGFSPL